MASPRKRSLGTVLLLAVALVLAAVLAYQAQDAARSHRRTAERALQDYASFATWQLSRHARRGLLGTMVTALVFPASKVDPARLSETIVSPEEVERRARRAAAWCDCLGGTELFFRYDWASGQIHTTDNAASAQLLDWVRDTIAGYTRAHPPVTDITPTFYGSADSASSAQGQLRVILTNDSYAMLAGNPGGRPRLVTFVISRDWQGRPLVLYGFVTNPAAFIGPAFRLVYKDRPVLPPSLLRGLDEDSVMSVTLSEPGGRVVFRSPGSATTAFAAADTLPPNFGSLVLSVSLRPEVADQLVVGGLPRSRLPVLIALFVLTAGLVVVALLQLRRQQELVRLRTDFISGVSHELRTPLAQIRWFAELLHMGKLRTEADRDRSLRIIDQEARRLTFLVENVLAFARAERRSGRVSPVESEIERDVREALESFAPIARSRRATLRLELEYGLRVRVDHDAFRQILLNLLDNAVKYGPPGQTLTVGTQSVGDESHPRVRVWVEDQGPGIPAAERERVWEPYVRLGREAEGATGGSGIGLSVVRELVTLHGGRVWAEDGAGGGTRVVFEIPALAPHRDGRSHHERHEPPRDPKAVAAELMWTSGSFTSGAFPSGTFKKNS